MEKRQGSEARDRSHRKRDKKAEAKPKNPAASTGGGKQIAASTSGQAEERPGKTSRPSPAPVADLAAIRNRLGWSLAAEQVEAVLLGGRREAVARSAKKGTHS